MAARKGLGKGIDAMISGDNTKTKQVVKEVVKEVDTIDINKIENTYKYLLVSSDGLHGYVEKKVISDIVHDSSLSLQEKTETLIARANQSGGYDNCTVILMENDGE